MKVFNACMKIIKNRILTFVIYFGIFIGISAIMSQVAKDQNSSTFTETKPEFTIINRDAETPYTKGLLDYLKAHGTYVKLEDDKEDLQDARFNGAVNYILIIPEGFQDSFVSGGSVELEENMTKDSADGYQMSGLVNQYWNQIASWEKAGTSMDQQAIAKKAVDVLGTGAEIEKKQFLEKQSVSTNFRAQHTVGAYIMLIVGILCVSTLFIGFQRPDIRMRNMCSPIKPHRKMLEMTLATGCIAFLFWFLLMASTSLLFINELKNVDYRILLLIFLNSFIFQLLCLMLALLVSLFIRDEEMQQAAANIVSLGLCFLGGAFVPVEMLGAQVLNVSRFLPVYWYETALADICGLTGFTAADLNPIWKSMLIQLGFAAAMLCIALAVNKQKSSAEESFATTRTELEA